MTGDLTTWETVRAKLGLDDDRREVTEFLVSSASAQAEKIAGRILAARDVDIELDGNGGMDFKLPGYPVNRTDKVSVNGAETSGYKIKPDVGLLRVTGFSGTGWGAVGFKGNIGYDPVPSDLQQAAIEMVAANLRRLASGVVGIKVMSANNAITTQYELDIPASARSVFLSYWEARV